MRRRDCAGFKSHEKPLVNSRLCRRPFASRQGRQGSTRLFPEWTYSRVESGEGRVRLKESRERTSLACKVLRCTRNSSPLGANAEVLRRYLEVGFQRTDFTDLVIKGGKCPPAPPSLFQKNSKKKTEKVSSYVQNGCPQWLIPSASRKSCDTFRRIYFAARYHAVVSTAGHHHPASRAYNIIPWYRHLRSKQNVFVFINPRAVTTRTLVGA